jgi:hypothetical protein
VSFSLTGVLAFQFCVIIHTPYLANNELTLRSRQSLRTLRNLRPRPCSCLLNSRLMEWNGNVEHTSKANQVDRYLQTDTVTTSSETLHHVQNETAE